MKKFLMFALNAALLLCLLSGINAEEIETDYEVKTIEIDLDIDDIEGLSDIEIGKMKLKKAGYSDKLIDAMPERMFLKAKNATTLYRTVRYPASDDLQEEKTANEENKKTKNPDEEIAELLSQIKIIENNESDIEINE
ncbi:MAG: hypothetical protein GX213_05370 [Clostridiaceae bacterium]|nr:hypothetical protein [Clostridiaceae bacterium]